eukprot:1968706-Amphidinium_carterae.3
MLAALVHNLAILVVQDAIPMNVVVNKLSCTTHHQTKQHFGLERGSTSGTFVAQSIWPLQDTITMSIAPSPLPMVPDTTCAMKLLKLSPYALMLC